MVDKIRMSGPTLKLLKVLLENPKRALSGAEISKITDLGSGTLYPLLQRLATAGWIVGEWEKVDPSEIGRPKRRLYKLTRSGQAAALKEFAQYETPQWQHYHGPDCASRRRPVVFVSQHRRKHSSSRCLCVSGCRLYQDHSGGRSSIGTLRSDRERAGMAAGFARTSHSVSKVSTRSWMLLSRSEDEALCLQKPC